MKYPKALFLAGFVVLLAACINDSTIQESQRWPVGQELTDSQGAVEVTVTPIDSSDSELSFEVSLDTHSVNLSMDITQLSTMRTDTGLIAEPNFWEGPQGGHHVSGLLVFPASVNGSLLLDNATQITLIIAGVDARQRMFVWNLE